MNRCIIISGPTASGKTQTAINVYEHLIKSGHKSVIFNYDSLLFYKNLNIGTAKPSDSELKNIPHKLVNICEISNHINAAKYEKLAKEELKSLPRETIPIFVGGSAFYIRALIKGMYEGETVTEETRAKSDTLYKEKGISPFIDFLKINDSDSFSSLHENDHYRIIRAVEFFWQTGSAISKQKAKLEENDPYDFNKNQWENLKFSHLYLDIEKEEHFKIIQKRTTKMFEDGLIEEVKNLLKSFSGAEKPLQSIGYKEVQEYLKGEFNSEEELMERISISTRQLAKSQRTFYKKITPKTQFNAISDQEAILSHINSFLID